MRETQRLELSVLLEIAWGTDLCVQGACEDCFMSVHTVVAC